LRIVTDENWAAAHRHLVAVRTLYQPKPGGTPGGRPPVGNASKYLLTNLALCGCCGHTFKALSRTRTGAQDVLRVRHGRTR
jgi:hypothetical protein